MGEQWGAFPSIKFFSGTYISQRNSICLNDRRNSNASGVCGDCQRRSSAPLSWKLAILVLAVLFSMLVGGVAKSFWNCRSGESSTENWLFASWMTTSRNKSSRPEARSCGSTVNWTQREWTCLQKRSWKCLLELRLLHCGSPDCLYWSTCVLGMFTKAPYPFFFIDDDYSVH